MTYFPLPRRATTTVLSVVLLCCLPLHAAFAWSSTGHMIAATIAYRSLPVELQRKYIAILQSHPEYASWKKNYKGNVDEGAYLFMRASVWPDELKRDRGNPDTHAEWHYINFPLIAPAYALVDPPAAGSRGDIMTAIALNQTVLANRSASARAQAIALAWLLHLIGDLHQPLHTTALISEIYKAPKGDKGGNDFFIRPSERAKKPISLHQFWDGLLGTSKDFRKAHNDAIAIERNYRRSDLAEMKRGSSVRDWILQSRAIAITSVYLAGKLLGVDDKSLDAPVVPDDYRANAKRVAERRIALAGYRLAELLRGDLHVGAE